MSKSLAFCISAFAFCLGLLVCLLFMSPEISEQKKEIAVLRAEIKSMETRIVALYDQIKDRDKKIVILQKNIGFLEDPLK